MVADSDITLTHQTRMAFDLKWEQVLELCEDVVKDMLEVQDNHTVLVHVDKIDKLNTILEKVEMQSISFEPDYINLCFVLLQLWCWQVSPESFPIQHCSGAHVPSCQFLSLKKNSTWKSQPYGNTDICLLWEFAI